MSSQERAARGRATASADAPLPPAELSAGSAGTADAAMQNALLRALCDSLSPAYAADAAGNIVYSNPAFATIARALFGLPADVQAIDETPPPLMRILERLYLARGPIETRDDIEIDGSPRTYVGRHMPVKTAAGDILGVCGVYTDLTAAAAAVRRAGQMEAWLQDVVRSATDWVWSADANLNLTFVSPRIAETVGVPPQVLHGRYLLSLGEFAATPGPTPKELLARRAPFRRLPFRMTDAEGGERYIHLSGVPVFDDASGKFVGYRGTGTDVTRQRAAEDAARASAERLEKTLETLKARNLQLDLALDEARVAEKAKMEFLAMMSHELRTPLNAIIGFSDAAMHRVLGPLSDGYHDYFRDIHKAGQHLLAIIGDILDSANIESQTLAVRAAPVRLRDLLLEARSLVAIRAQGKNLDLSAVEIADHYTVLADRLRTRQILVNLLGNAVKFTPEGGRIGAETREFPDGRLALTIWDSGIGIPAEEQERVFERFYQVKSDILSRKNEGTGLGLSVSRYLAQLMGGDLTLESEPGRGARFTLTLPLAKPVTAVAG